MKLWDEIQTKKPAIAAIANRYGVSKFKAFGSLVRLEDGDNSDVDLLVYWSNPEWDLIDLISVRHDLENLFGRKVDLLTENSLNKHIRQTIIATSIDI